MISIVISVFNEEESLTELHKALTKSIKKIDINYEFIFVDDGSIDGTLDILKDIEKNDENVKIFSYRRNQGKAEALTLGFSQAKGDYIVTLDADLQDRPDQIEKVINKLLSDRSLGLVCGWRKDRKDSMSKVISSKLFNFLAGRFWGLKLHDYNCGLKAYSKDAAKSLTLYGGMHRFIPLLAYDQGFTVTEVAVEHDKRKYGKSKYGFSKIWKDFPDIFTMLFLSKYGKRPMHFFGLIGGMLILAGVIILIYLSLIHFQGQSIGRRPLLFLGMLLVLGGFQVFFTGFLADIILNTQRKEDKEMSLKYSSYN